MWTNSKEWKSNILFRPSYTRCDAFTWSEVHGRPAENNELLSIVVWLNHKKRDEILSQAMERSRKCEVDKSLPSSNVIFGHFFRHSLFSATHSRLQVEFSSFTSSMILEKCFWSRRVLPHSIQICRELEKNFSTFDFESNRARNVEKKL